MLSYLTSFHYAFYATFLHQLSPPQLAIFNRVDHAYQGIFVVDLII
jgi:hypothetical protein